MTTTLAAAGGQGSPAPAAPAAPAAPDGGACCAPAGAAGTGLRPEAAAGYVAVLKALADPHRLRMLSLIAGQPADAPLCVCEIEGEVGLAQPTDSNIAHALAVAEQPLTATHDNARAVYAHPRNFADAQLRAVAANGGVVGVHFLRMMCDPQRLLLDAYLDHVAHVARVAGPAHVGIGWLGADAGFREVAGSHGNSFRTTADGAPLEMREAYATLIERLAARGWSDDALRAFLGGNYLRVLRQVLPAGAGAGVEVEAPAV